MIAILAPSKTMDFESDSMTLPQKIHPLFKKNTESIVKHLKLFSIEELMALMKISKKIAEENHQRFRDFSYGSLPDRQRPSVFAFQGDVYKGLDAQSFNAEDLLAAEGSIRILSGLYGMLSPFTMIEAYRFEMGLKFDAIKASAFWKGLVTDELNSILSNKKNKIIIDLASAEYMAAIDKKKLDAKIIDIVFRENRDGNLKTIAVFAKKARGMMARYIVKERVKTIDALKEFNREEYLFDAALSTENSFVFVR